MPKLKKQMYSFKIKADASDIDVPLIRSLLSVSAVLTFIGSKDHNHLVGIGVVIVIILLSLFVEQLLIKFRLDPLIILGIASALTLVASQEKATFILVLFFFLIAITMRIAYISPTVDIAENGIRIKKSFSEKKYDWSTFYNVIVKDNILTLDFKNNKVLQLELEGNIPEKDFNQFCSGKILTSQSASLNQ